MTDTVLNTKPIYSSSPVIAWSTTPVKTANIAVDGTGPMTTVFTADATNGGRVEKLKIRGLGTNVATVLRVFINNGADPTVAANNSLFTELSIAATTLSQNAALADNELPLNLALPPGYKLNVAIGTTVAAGLQVTAVGGKY